MGVARIPGNGSPEIRRDVDAAKRETRAGGGRIALEGAARLAMVSAGGALNVAHAGVRARSSVTSRARQLAGVALLAAICAAGCVMLAGREPRRTELRAIGLHHRLTTREKEFVAQATSTPDVDLHKAAKLQSEKAAQQMDKYFTKQKLALKKKDEVAKKHLEVMHKKATTKAAQKDLDTYFDSMKQAVKKEHTVELSKHKGTGAAARAESNLYFKQLQAKQARENKADEARLRAESTFHSKHGTALAASADINGYFDKLQEKTKQEDIQREKKHPAKHGNPYSFVTPTAAKNGGEAVRVHKHDEEGIQMSTKKANDDLNSYFDNLDKSEKKVNQHDTLALADNHKFDKKDLKPSTEQSQLDIKHYFKAMHKDTLSRDERDVARLRKDKYPANLQEGVNYATAAAAKARALKAKQTAAAKLARKQALRAKQAAAHKLQGSAVSGI